MESLFVKEEDFEAAQERVLSDPNLDVAYLKLIRFGPESKADVKKSIENVSGFYIISEKGKMKETIEKIMEKFNEE